VTDVSPIVASAVGLAAGAVLALATWLASLRSRDVSIVDCVWGFLVLLPACVMALMADDRGSRTPLVLSLAAVWAVRLSGYIAWRHRGQPEDRRYREIRERNLPNFEWKSLYLVFGLQALLGWIVATPLMAAVTSRLAYAMLDLGGIALVLFGLIFEAVADAQLASFKSKPSQGERVMSTGLWRYSRHPNYFGECCIWWGFWLVALSAGAWWSVVSPLLMTMLLLKVSGVRLLEKDLAQRRPAYRDYVRRTNAFFPWSPRS
jgi:steroid 5-alpha reductase family enzyme